MTIGAVAGGKWRASRDKTLNWEIIVPRQDVSGRKRRNPPAEKTSSDGKVPAKSRSSRCKVPGQTELAEKLTRETVPDGKGGRRVRTRAEIEAALVKRLGIPRTVAQVASHRAVRKLDPDNPVRRTHKKPIARSLSEEQKALIRDLRKKGMNKKEIAEMLGANPRTIQRHWR